MKVERDPTFTPITVTLESSNECAQLMLFLHIAEKQLSFGEDKQQAATLYRSIKNALHYKNDNCIRG